MWFWCYPQGYSEVTSHVLMFFVDRKIEKGARIDPLFIAIQMPISLYTLLPVPLSPIGYRAPLFMEDSIKRYDCEPCLRGTKGRLRR